MQIGINTNECLSKTNSKNIVSMLLLFLLDEPIDKVTLKEVDKFIWNLPIDIIEEFLKLILTKLDMVVEGKLPNWRHDLVVGKKPTYIDGKRLMPHDLSSMCATDIGDFHEAVTNVTLKFLEANYPDRFEYNLKVLIPTIRIWILISMAELSAAEARFYLVHGGSISAKLACKNLRKRAGKFTVS